MRGYPSNFPTIDTQLNKAIQWKDQSVRIFFFKHWIDRLHFNWDGHNIETGWLVGWLVFKNLLNDIQTIESDLFLRSDFSFSNIYWRIVN